MTSLGHEFRSGKLQLRELEATVQHDDKGLHSAISMFEHCQELVARLQLFSGDESLEDVSTSEIQYLNVELYLAQLHEMRQSNRKEAVEHSRSLYMQFLSHCEAYGLLEDRRVLARLRSGLTSIADDPPSKREARIIRFKLEKQLQASLQSLESLSDRTDDEEARKLYISEIHLNVLKAFQSIDTIISELPLLLKQEEPEFSGHKDVRERDRSQEYDDQLDTRPRGILSPDGRPLQPFVITSQREKVRNGVFRPDHSLPTMTIEEYLTEEARRGGIVQSGPEEVQGIDDDSYEQADLETMKAREWDEFTELNPKGSGNTMNRG